jgi:hypothetical protein
MEPGDGESAGVSGAIETSEADGEKFVSEIEFIKSLDAAAGTGSEVNVADGVIRRIRVEQSAPAEPRPMWGAAILSGLAAAIVAFIAIQSFTGLQNPFGDLITPVWTTFQ